MPYLERERGLAVHLEAQLVLARERRQLAQQRGRRGARLVRPGCGADAVGATPAIHPQATMILGTGTRLPWTPLDLVGARTAAL